MAIVAPNVAHYVHSKKEYFAPDNSLNGELMYLQFSIVRDEGRVFEEAYFQQFLENRTSFDGVIPSSKEAVVVRGFLDQAPGISQVSDIVAVLRFSFSEEMSEERVNFGIGLQHESDPTGPRYFIRDEKDRTIDGITVDNNPIEIQLPELTERECEGEICMKRLLLVLAMLLVVYISFSNVPRKMVFCKRESNKEILLFITLTGSCPGYEFN
ncbi:hypothetical protein V511_02115 [Mesotoga sp. Brook.08.YT.4.2.5.1]|uniref:hypothetical protein n=1 Tax=unclassified Mesotoga TaxID=1184398 RepID=UPI000C187A88|nr:MULTISPECIES: hypothetical protein [unclassified Mesotoga]PNE23503.1 hypothetical protein V511_02115 [Mesotoga sp. Brook.08.YT.4.2.5.1]PVD16794.1 hypothetical protein V512_007660 [Mesotoga sp. Brook.08.105.5.1]RAO95682.1 hypothetical protein M388_04080 [Mesotoga sp. Brook.08.YT.4.2.5.4.]RDI92252.1 hypothetical protein Q502_10285 [Mesotoga sp. Brook.08.YT.4.2.5.2.]